MLIDGLKEFCASQIPLIPKNVEMKLWRIQILGRLVSFQHSFKLHSKGYVCPTVANERIVLVVF